MMSGTLLGAKKGGVVYYPFGLTFNSYQRENSLDQKFLYNGKELQDELQLDWFDYGARMYDPIIARWMSIDPLSQLSGMWSPYAYCYDNPLIFVDPDGMLAAPIYDTNGDFLGTDDQGLQGKAIVMSKEDFQQGMSHEEALQENLGASGLKSEEARSNFSSHYGGLKDRPDYDGFVTIGEGIDWAKGHPNALENPGRGDALYLDASKLDFGSLRVENFPIEIGVKGNVNLFDFVEWTNSRSRATTYALGNTQMTLRDGEGTVQLYSDLYDWDYHNYDTSKPGQAGTLPKSTRDKLIMMERTRARVNDSHGFPVFIFGKGNLKRKI